LPPKIVTLSGEVLREGLRLLEERDLLERIAASSMAELEKRLRAGVAGLERGEGLKAIDGACPEPVEGVLQANDMPNSSSDVKSYSILAKR
jgi:hypothetical protein